MNRNDRTRVPRLRPALSAGALAGLALLFVSCGGPRPPAAPVPDIQAGWVRGELPRTDATAAAWKDAPEHVAQLLLQDQTEPKLLKPGVASVRIRALHDGSWIVFRLEWDDPSADRLAAPSRFGDAAAVQFPVLAGGDVPDAAMGQAGRPVRITVWRAPWQERLDTGADPVAALYPHAHPDHYPPQAAEGKDREALETLYAPARGAGNPVTILRPDSPTQDLEAEGFGTLTPAAGQVSSGKGTHDGKTWRVTLARPLDSDPAQALRPGARSYAAFAIWEGSAGNSGARKMRSGWIPLSLAVKP